MFVLYLFLPVFDLPSSVRCDLYDRRDPAYFIYPHFPCAQNSACLAHGACPRYISEYSVNLGSEQFPQGWALWPQLEGMEQSRNQFLCSIWQWERGFRDADWVGEHHISAPAFQALCSGCLFTVLTGIWDQISFLSLSCKIISVQKEASN